LQVFPFPFLSLPSFFLSNVFLHLMGLLKLERSPFNLPTPLIIFQTFWEQIERFWFQIPCSFNSFLCAMWISSHSMDESSFMKIHQISRWNFFFQEIQPKFYSDQIHVVQGCKQDILYIFLTLFSTWKHTKIVFKFLTFLSISKQMKLFFSMGISSLLLAFKTICVISFGLEKVSQKYPPKYFFGLGMTLVTKTNLMNQK
jgi:hypothetical protein